MVPNCEITEMWAFTFVGWSLFSYKDKTANIDKSMNENKYLHYARDVFDQSQ